MPRYALVIGISQYENFRDLPKAATDAESIATVLERNGYQVTRLPRKRVGENQWAIDPNKPLTQTNLSQELKEFLQKRTVRQEVVIYFAGHGFRVTDPLTDEPVGYWATSDAKSNGQNAVPLHALGTLISKSELSSLVMLMDCCYAGAFVEQQSLLKPAQDAIGQKQNYCLIAACRDFEKAREGEQHGIFTAAVLKGLSADNVKQGKITSNDLFGSVSRELQSSGQEVIFAGKGSAIPLIHAATPSEGLNSSTITLIDETCPYQGLKPFDKFTAKFFYGREAVVHRLLEQLERSPFVPVIGASGSGKSSVVRAGLIPALEDRGWRVLNIIHPGIEPIAKLKAVLEQFFRDREQLSIFAQIHPRWEAEGFHPVIGHLAGGRTLLVIDQFEEVFTLCPKEEERRQFIDWLTQKLDDSTSLSVAITLRVDFLESCLHYRKLAQLIQDWQILILPFDELELRQIIVDPAEQQGYQLAEGLLDLILDDIRYEKNCLPLLEFALTELWQPATEQGHKLTIANYLEIGRVSGTLNRHAEDLYKRLTPIEQEWAKRIFLKLVRTGEEERDTRQRQPKQHLLDMSKNAEAMQAIERVLQVMVDGRLLVMDIIAPLDKQEGQVTIVDLAHEALMEGWKRFIEWRQENRAIRRIVNRIEDSYREWLSHQQDDQFLLMGGLLTQVNEQWNNIEDELPLAIQEFFKKSYIYGQNQLSFLELGIESKLNQQAQLVRKIFDKQPFGGIIGALQLLKQNLEQLPDRVLESTVKILYLASNTEIPEIIQASQKGPIWAVRFSPYGDKIVSASSDRTIRLWDLKGNPIGEPFRGHEDAVLSVAFSPNGNKIASASSDGTIRLWDLKGNQIEEPFRGHDLSVWSVCFSPDGNKIASCGGDCTIRLWDLQGVPIGEPFRGHEDAVLSVAFNPNGNKIASGSSDATIRLWDLNGSPISEPLLGHKDAIRSIVFSPDGNKIASSSRDRTIRIWNLRDRRRKPISLTFHQCSVFAIAFSLEGELIYNASHGEPSRIRDLQDAIVFPVRQAHSNSVLSISLSPREEIVASSTADGAIYFWKLSPYLTGKNRNWQDLLQSICNKIRDHSYFLNPQTEAVREVCEVCREYVWEKAVEK